MNKKAIFGLGAIISTVFGYFIVYMMGRGKTHASGLNFSAYTINCLFWIFAIAIPGIIGGFILALIVMKKRDDPTKEPYIDKKDGKRKLRDKYPSLIPAALVIAVFAFVGIYAMLGVATLLRAWVFNADSADIQIDTADSGDFRLMTGTVKDYRQKDLAMKLVTLKERYQLVFGINCTQFTSGNDTVQLYNDTTATLEGYNDKKEKVSGPYAPTTQPGSFTTTSGTIVVIFWGVSQQMNNPLGVITTFNLSIVSSSGTVLASWIIHTDPKLSYWTANTQA